MNIIEGIKNYKNSKPTILTVGTFDGVHLGHQKIIRKLKEEATRLHAESLILTFHPHPRKVLQPEIPLQLIQTIEERISALEKAGLDTLIIQPFDKQFSRLSAEEYVEQVLVHQLDIKKIIIGYDHRFGRNREANIKDLRHFATIFDFEVEEISVAEIDLISISSTKIRKAISNGNLNLVQRFLGRPFELGGNVVHGNQLGRSIGFPTANIEIGTSDKLIPNKGVYWIKGLKDMSDVYGMMNIGTKPTVKSDLISVEIHFFDWNKDLYNSTIYVQVLKRLRDEKKFNSIVDLKEQLQKDEKRCRKWQLSQR